MNDDDDDDDDDSYSFNWSQTVYCFNLLWLSSVIYVYLYSYFPYCTALIPRQHMLAAGARCINSQTVITYSEYGCCDHSCFATYVDLPLTFY